MLAVSSRRRVSLEGKFSFQYVAAYALLDGRVGIDTFTDERRLRSDVEAMLPKMRVIQSPEIPATLNRMWMEIRLTLADGTIVVGRCVKPSGAWSNSVSEDAHRAKARDSVRTAFDAAAVDEIIATTRRFDALDATSVRVLMRRLGYFPAASASGSAA